MTDARAGMRPPPAPGAGTASPGAGGGARAPTLVLLLVITLSGCDAPLTEADESLAIRTVFRDLAAERRGAASADSIPASACLHPRFLARDDSTVPPLLETALRQRGVLLYRAEVAPDTGLRLVAVSPVRELDGALALEAALGRTAVRGDSVRHRWTEWTYRLRCEPAACSIVSRLGPRRSVEAVPEPRADAVRRGEGGRCPR